MLQSLPTAYKSSALLNAPGLTSVWLFGFLLLLTTEIVVYSAGDGSPG